jgi:hypothetical protein
MFFFVFDGKKALCASLFHYWLFLDLLLGTNLAQLWKDSFYALTYKSTPPLDIFSLLIYIYYMNIFPSKWKAYLGEEVVNLTKIGVEQSLTNIQQALREKGYDVVELKQETDANGCSCCVISGADSNVMGMQDALTKGSVIDATGLSADEVCQQVESRIY